MKVPVRNAMTVVTLGAATKRSSNSGSRRHAE